MKSKVGFPNQILQSNQGFHPTKPIAMTTQYGKRSKTKMKPTIANLPAFLSVVLVCVYLTVPLLAAGDSFISKGVEANRVKPFVTKIVGDGGVIDAIQTTSGGYVSLSQEQGSSTFTVRKMKSSGKVVWETSLRINSAQLNSIAQTNDGYVLAGYKRVLDYWYYYYSSSYGIIIKLDSKGKLLYGIQSLNLSFTHVSGSHDGGFIAVADGGGSALVVLKFSSSGALLWNKKYRVGVGYPFSVRTIDHGLIFAKAANTGTAVIKLDDSGNQIWQQKIKVGNFELQAVGATSDNGIILASKCIDCSDLLLLALDAKGAVAWSVKYSLKIGEFGVSDVISMPDGGYALTGGATNKAGRATSGFLMKIDSSRKIVFERTWGTPGNQEGSRSIFTTAHNGIVLFGSSGRHDSLFLNLNSDGTVPGCSFLRTPASSTSSSGKVTTGGVKIKASSNPNLSVTPFDVSASGSAKPLVSICP
jgi:hypothetical protein